MTEIEQKALALVEDILPEDAYRAPDHFIDKRILWNALCRAIEQHEQFKRQVSDKVEAAKRVYGGHREAFDQLDELILPKPVDPLVELAREMTLLDGVVRTDSQKAAIREGRAGNTASDDFHDRLRAALAARGLKIVEAE